MLTRSIGIAVLAVLGLASSVAADPPAPFAQSGLPHSLDCPPPGIPPFADTGLSATFGTKTDAVLISVMLVVDFPPNSGFVARPTIDGVGFNSDPHATYLWATEREAGERQGKKVMMRLRRP